MRQMRSAPSTSYKLTVNQTSDYLHAVVTGTNSRDNVKSYLEEVLRECMQRGCRRLLIEERLDGPRLDTLGIFQIASEMSAQAQGVFEAVAYVDVNAVGDRNLRFAEDVAVNRGLPGRMFSSVGDAERWLRGEDGGGAGGR